MSDKEQIMHDALDHIAKVAGMARTLTKRLDWIVARAKTAIQGDEWDSSYKPMPTSDLPGRLRLKAENESLRAHCDVLLEQIGDLAKLRAGADIDIREAQGQIEHLDKENNLLREQLHVARNDAMAEHVKQLLDMQVLEEIHKARAEERERCKKAVSEAGWLHLGDDAHSKHMDRAAIQQVNSCVEAIEALGDAEEQAK